MLIPSTDRDTEYKKFCAKRDILFYMGITFEVVFMLFNLGAYTVPEWLNIGRFMQFASILFLGKILLTKYSVKEWMIIGLTIAFGMISFFATGRDEWVLRVVLMLIASKGIDSVRISKYILKLTLVGTTCIVLLSLIGIGQPMINTMDYGRGFGEESRWTFGMGHPNHLHGLFCYVCMLSIYIYHQKLKWYHYLSVAILNVILFFFTISRTGLLATEILVVGAWIITGCKKEMLRKCLFIYGIVAIWGTVIFTIYVGKCGVHGTFLTLLDKALSGRLTFIDWYGDPETWRLFSQADDIGRATIDVTYGAIVNAYGYAVLFAYTILNTLLQIRLYKEKNDIGMVIFQTCILYGMMENYMNSYFLMYNVVFILIMGRWHKLLDFGKQE